MRQIQQSECKKGKWLLWESLFFKNRGQNRDLYDRWNSV